MATNKNIDLYALARVGIFFPGFPNSLTGQCVSLIKWFLAEMCDIPNPQGARGNAKDFGDTLVNQGLAYVVSAADRKQGDLVVWKQDAGGVGHIAVLCSGGNVFEGNVGLQGTTRAVFDGNVVFASRIDPLYASWRVGPPTFYRVKSYVENVQKGPEVAIIQNADNWRGRVNRTVMAFWGRPFTEAEFQSVVGKDTLPLIEILGDNPETDNQIHRAAIGNTAINDKWDQQIYALQAIVADLNKRPTQAELDELGTKADTLATSATQAQLDAKNAIAEAAAARAETKRLQDEADANEQSAKSFIQKAWAIISKLLPGGK